MGTLGRPFNMPSLGGGGSTSFSRTETFTTQGCDHVVYVWVDRDNEVAESNEQNNLIALPVCVGVECEVDSYETDNLCTAAGWLSEDVTQARSFCHPVDKQLADMDWVKFTAFTGVTYTLSTANLGAHADPKLTLYASCGGAAIPGQGTGLTWRAPASGVYFAQIEHRNPPYGPQTQYDLTLSATTGVTDKYEPDNRCALARDITTGGVRQTHLFQAPNDEDWIKFVIRAGESFALIADNTAAGVNPILDLFTDCDGTPLATSTVQAAAARLDASSATDQVYYAKAVNQNPAIYGVDAHYDVRVLASTCVPDGREEDDSFGQAKTLGLGGAGTTSQRLPGGGRGLGQGGPAKRQDLCDLHGQPGQRGGHGDLPAGRCRHADRQQRRLWLHQGLPHRLRATDHGRLLHHGPAPERVRPADRTRASICGWRRGCAPRTTRRGPRGTTDRGTPAASTWTARPNPSTSAPIPSPPAWATRTGCAFPR